MCGRYYIGDERDRAELQRIIDEANRRAPEGGVKDGGEIFPSDCAPVLARGRSVPRGAFPMTWGYALEGGRRVINARSETAAQKPLFRDGMRRRRCAVPASHYFEWTHDGARRRYAIRPRGEGLMYMAGIYRLTQGAPEFAILTRQPAEEIRFIHDRMPVLLPGELLGAWLDPDCEPDGILSQAIQSLVFAEDPGAPRQLRLEF